jgi:hypothetical protein
MLTVRHPQRWIEGAQVLEPPFRGRKAGNAVLQFIKVAADPGIVPLQARVADDSAHVSLRRIR